MGPRLASALTRLRLLRWDAYGGLCESGRSGQPPMYIVYWKSTFLLGRLPATRVVDLAGTVVPFRRCWVGRMPTAAEVTELTPPEWRQKP